MKIFPTQGTALLLLLLGLRFVAAINIDLIKIAPFFHCEVLKKILQNVAVKLPISLEVTPSILREFLGLHCRHVYFTFLDLNV